MSATEIPDEGSGSEKPGRARRVIGGASAKAALTEGASRADEAYAFIRDRILALEMAPGSLFTEGGIAKSLGASKTPIREALVRLEHEGLVRSTPRSGYQVSPITLKDTRELGELRGMLLVEAAGRAAAGGLGTAEIERLEALVVETDVASAEGTLEAIETSERLHREFDLAVARATGNDWLISTLGLIFDELHRVRLLGSRLDRRRKVTRVSRQRDVLDAIRAGDPAAARAVMRERVEVGQEMTLMSLLESPAVMSANLGAGFDG